MRRNLLGLMLVAGLVSAAGGARAGEFVWGGKLDVTRGVTAIEGAGGGGLATWALITGNETDDGVGGEANGTYVNLADYTPRAYGAGVGLFDRLEVTYEGQDFDTGRDRPRSSAWGAASPSTRTSSGPSCG